MINVKTGCSRRGRAERPLSTKVGHSAGAAPHDQLPCSPIYHSPKAETARSGCGKYVTSCLCSLKVAARRLFEECRVNNREYFCRRAGQERQAAVRSATMMAFRAHMAMAREYGRRVLVGWEPGDEDGIASQR